MIISFYSNINFFLFLVTCGDEDNASRVFDGIKNKIPGEYNAMFKGKEY
jgi:hypothetical protein